MSPFVVKVLSGLAMAMGFGGTILSNHLDKVTRDQKIHEEAEKAAEEAVLRLAKKD